MAEVFRDEFKIIDRTIPVLDDLFPGREEFQEGFLDCVCHNQRTVTLCSLRGVGAPAQLVKTAVKSARSRVNKKIARCG